MQREEPSAAYFASPEEALAQLVRVVASEDKEQARDLFGSDGEYLFDSGDQTLDQGRAKRFIEMFKERHDLRAKSSGEYSVFVGSKGWPFPVPLVRDASGWTFDALAGKEEILARRIGENEFAALDTARAVYHAQRLYAAYDRNGDGKREYAAKLISTPGKKDGLYWPPEREGEDLSPLNTEIVQAARESYVITPDGKPHPYHGYYYKLRYLEPHAKEEIADALSKPGRYWFLATPAVWNQSGVMTFALNERGWIYEKDLGVDLSPEMLSAISVDETWQRVE
jgi:hypothetical protein